MKRFVASLLVLLLSFCSAGAESLAQRLGAPEHVTDVFLSNTGKTEITVNAVVEIPQVEKVPIVAVTPGTFTQSQLLQAADAFIGAGSYSVPRQSVEDCLAAGPQGGVNMVDWNAVTENKQVNFVQWYNMQGLTTYCCLSGFERGQANINTPHWPFGYMPCEAPSAIRRQALKLQESLAPFMALSAQGVASADMEDGPVYQFIFTRSLAGIPTAHTSDGCFAADSPDDIYSARQFPYETLFILITPEGKMKWVYLSPYLLGETLAEDTQLLPFDKIIGIARLLLPLSHQYREKVLDKLRYTVDRITFGYTRVKQRNNPNEYMLVPCWDFFNAEQADESLLTINAIDGTVIDRDFGY